MIKTTEGPEGPYPPTQARADAESYRWIRANRGNYDITDALAGSDRDADFDGRIDMAIRRTDRRHTYTPATA